MAEETIERTRLTQSGPEVQALINSIPQKVDKVIGKQLSTNDYTDAEKAKLAQALTAHQSLSHLETSEHAAATYQPKGNYQPAGSYQPSGDYPTRAEIAAAYQVLLQSGINIKTVNGHSILGSGNIILVGEGAEEGTYISTEGGELTGILVTRQIKPKEDSASVAGSSKAHYSKGYFDKIAHGKKVDGEYPNTPDESVLAQYDADTKKWVLGSDIVIGNRNLLEWLNQMASSSNGAAAAMGVDVYISGTNPSANRVPTTQAIVDYLQRKMEEPVPVDPSTLYDAIDELGVAIIDKDYKLYANAASWYAAERPTVLGIALSDETHRRVLHLDELSGYMVAERSDNLTSLTNTAFEDTAKADYNGVGNTNYMKTQTEGKLVNSCYGKTFADGTHGYMPSAGEFMSLIVPNLEAINTLMGIVGGTAIYASSSRRYTTSTCTNKSVSYQEGYSVYQIWTYFGTFGMSSLGGTSHYSRVMMML